MTDVPAGLVVPRGATWADLRDPLRSLLDADPVRALLGADPARPRSTGARPAALVVATSGSSGAPKQVRLSGEALRASGEATAQVLGGHGRWVLALPTHHVAGLQVLARSALAGTIPVALDPGVPFTAPAFARAVARLGPGAELRLAALVPTQLHRLLGADEGVAALRHLDAVLLGGAAADPALLVRAADAGARVVTTYGMGETCGGCVYDGVPLPGVRVRIDPADDRVWLGGPVLADGYVDRPALTAERFVERDGRRWFVTDDRGVWSKTAGADRLRVIGRVDDVIVSGGHKVEPRDVEAALRRLPGVADALVVGVPDAEWGQLVGALLVPAAGAPVPSVTALREALAPTLPSPALPWRVAGRDDIPLLPSGKPDRAAARGVLHSVKVAE